MTLRAVFHRPLRLTVGALWLVGIGLAGWTAPLASRRSGVVSGLPFVGVVVAGSFLLRGVLQADRRALAISMVLLGAQFGGVIGSAWQLGQGVDGAKARELRRLGVDPTVGVAVNLVYSAVAFGVFGWAAARWLRARRSSCPGNT
jgi:hypothetical protein